jgi:hypothetical protein
MNFPGKLEIANIYFSAIFHIYTDWHTCLIDIAMVEWCIDEFAKSYGHIT